MVASNKLCQNPNDNETIKLIAIKCLTDQGIMSVYVTVLGEKPNWSGLAYSTNSFPFVMKQD